MCLWHTVKGEKLLSPHPTLSPRWGETGEMRSLVKSLPTGVTLMKEGYCGLCDQCRLGSPDLQAALAKIKTCVDQMPAFWQQQCLQAGQDFSLDEFRRGLDWFLGAAQCRGCKEAGGLKRCNIRSCARERRQEQCYICPDHDSCQHLIFV